MRSLPLCAFALVAEQVLYLRAMAGNGGPRDRESGRPVKKSTGWLSNSEVALNYLGKKCRCAWGAHEQIIGRDKLGSRAAQAAAYPVGVCRAVCQGVLRQMELDYQAVMVHSDGHYGYAGEDDMDIEEDQIDSLGRMSGNWMDKSCDDTTEYPEGVFSCPGETWTCP